MVCTYIHTGQLVHNFTLYHQRFLKFTQEDEDKSTKAPSNDGDGEEVEVDITTVDDVPFLDSR